MLTRAETDGSVALAAKSGVAYLSKLVSLAVVIGVCILISQQ